ncbi:MULTISPECIES: TAXI family TRAP transporter solute-binding subunit [unclassified Aeromonas]|uniref:TAXI family TRAP transporter solute-binding subunit n=1 Tax=unclassified Aeromonas TaxID=257493 RepID=UPI003529CA41
MHLRILRHLLLPLCALLPVTSQALTIGTGPVNGVYYPTGGAICRVLNADHALRGDRCTVQSTHGSLANLKALEEGDVQLALVQSDILHHALHGTGPFSGQGANHKLRSLFRLYQESLTLLASPTSGITTLADIEGKRVYPGEPGAGEPTTSQALMNAMGWHSGQFAAYQLTPGRDPLEGLCDGSLDAAFIVAGHPSLAIGDLAGRCKVRLIPIEGEQIDRLLKEHPYYQRSRIAANLYPGQITAINNIGMSAELVALASLPDPIVRTVRDTLLARVKQFSRLHPALSKITVERLQAQTELPLHAGMSDQAPEPLPLAPELLMPDDSLQDAPKRDTPEPATTEPPADVGNVASAAVATEPASDTSPTRATPDAAAPNTEAPDTVSAATPSEAVTPDNREQATTSAAQGTTPADESVPEAAAGDTTPSQP